MESIDTRAPNTRRMGMIHLRRSAGTACRPTADQGLWDPAPGHTHGSRSVPPTAYDPSSQCANVRHHSPAQPLPLHEQTGDSDARPPQQHFHHAIHTAAHYLPPPALRCFRHSSLHPSRQASSHTTPAQHKPVHEQQQQSDPAFDALSKQCAESLRKYTRCALSASAANMQSFINQPLTEII